MSKRKGELGENAMYVFKKLYFDEGEDKPIQVFRRVAKAICDAREDLKGDFEEFVRVQAENRLRVNSPAMMNLGCKRKQIASACYIGHVADDMSSIKQCYDDATEIFLAGAGIGVNYSDLREKDCPIKSGGASSGPESFIRHLNSLGGTIKSGGKCLAPYQTVWTTGGIKTVKALAEEKKAFYILSFDKRIGEVKIKLAQAWQSDYKEVWSLKTDKGEFHLSYDHPVMSAAGEYLKVEDLEQGMELKSKFLPERKVNETFPEGLEESNHKVKEVTKVGCMEVYDIEVQCDSIEGSPTDSHNFLIMPLNSTSQSGLIVSNTRRAAVMVMFDVTHPDVLDIIELKCKERLENMNISINLTDAFMKAVEADDDWELRGFVDGEVKKTIKARQLLKKISESIHQSGDPGVAFLDTVNRFHTVPSIGKIRTSNPCGEIFGAPYQSCNLGNINLSAHWDEKEKKVDWEELKKTVRVGIRLLDGMIDASEFPTENFKRVTKYTRNVGLGIMGLADLLIKAGLPYDEEKARNFAGSIMKLITETAWDESMEIASKSGPCGCYAEESTRERLETLWLVDRPVRNSHVTTIAPTGSTSISCECSAGMEPLFAIIYDKKISDTDDVMTFVHPQFEKLYSEEEWYTPQTIKLIKKHGGSIQKIPAIPDEVKMVWRTAHDIKWEDRVAMQAALQRHVTNSISSTVNLPQSEVPETIVQIIKKAYESGLKGITVYRDGSILTQPIRFGGIVPDKKRFQRPRRLRGFTDVVKTGQGNMYITINEFEKIPVECFVEIGKSGGNKKADAEALGRMTSLIFQMGGEVEMVYQQLVGIAGKDIIWENGRQVLSIYDALAKVLWDEYLSPTRKDSKVVYDECPKCGGRFIHREGCGECLDCNFSRCG